ncbi:MAG TPA: site-specific DNA-methyltransferase [Prevotella sp.]|nr:site-specific DNA-methyltransferase [Prevotella sp.]HCD65343.1 site-specific DNA-methyltransferase [Prevotella sp.]
MDKLRMQSSNGVEDNITKIAQLFPDCITETMDERSGQPKHLIDFEKLKQNLSDSVMSERAERYQFTWPDKSKAILLANSPINATLRPCREDSVDFDNTQNLYIEGDNLDVLKCLKETYLHKVKMIYIDPPYNTGNDFVYEDDFALSSEEYLANSGQYDEQGNRMFTNAESNGRFHTDWLNMIYPRLKVARDLLTDDGVIFISIGDEELQNLRKIADEVFGEANFRNQITIRRGAKSVQAQFDTWDRLGQGVEYLLLYTRNSLYRFPKQMKNLEEARGGSWNNHWRGTDRPTMRYEIFGICPSEGQWRWSKERSDKAIVNYKRLQDELNKEEPSQEEIDKWYSKQPEGTDLLRLSKKGKPEHYIKATTQTLLNNSWEDLLIGSSSEILKLFETKVFDTAKLTAPIKRMLNFTDKNAIVLDFFSGSATTAHAVMQLNSEDGGNRKFIMVQLPEKTDEKSEAFKAGYKNICEIGKERIRRAGKKIKEESPLTTQDLDTGFRVLKLDSTNMQDIYYSPKDISQADLFSQVDNVKPDRTGEDLLFQVMLELGATLDSKIETTTVAGKTIYNVAEGYLVACFDPDVTDDVVKAIAQMQPAYAVLRDTSMKDDSTATNFEQIFKTYSPDTVTKIL